MSHALGLAPFKDTFWTSEENPDHPYYYDCMIGSNNTDPNVPWPLTFRYSGYRDKTSKLFYAIFIYKLHMINIYLQ